MYRFMDHRRTNQTLQPVRSEARVLSHKFAADDTVMFAGENEGSLFLIRDGWVRLYRILNDDRTLVLGLLGPGEAFMQDTGSDGVTPTTAADALTDCEVTEIPFERVGAVLAKSPEYSRKLLSALASRQTATHDFIEQVLTRDTSVRLATILVDLAKAVGEETESEGVLRVTRSATHQALANMIGSNRVTVTRKLLDMQSRNLVRSLGRNSLEVDVPALRGFIEEANAPEENRNAA
ncbi:MAG TPA: Crp/Fnr family transcriptional regulator [Thermomicrobiales bacterium]|nr:Crp/Fnr family transcriptional regulator [Thermomicrobiales bacterium]